MQRYKKYKDSGVAWIGEIPEGWEVKRLKYVTSINDESLSDKTNYDYPIKYVDISNVKSGIGIVSTEHYLFGKAPNRARRVVRNGDVIVSTVRTYLKSIARIENPSDNLIVSTGFAVIRPQLITSGYIGFLFYSEFFIGEIISKSTGVSYPAINSSEIGEIFIPIPKIIEQQKISTYLTQKTKEIDTLIAQKEQLLKLYEEEKRAVINEAVTKGINADVAMKDSGIAWIREIPEHWEVKRLKYIMKSLNRVRIPLSGDIRGKMIQKVYDYYGASGVIDKVEEYLFDEPLLLIGEDGANLLDRNSRLVFIAKGKYWVNNHAHILKPKMGLLEYYCELLELYDFAIWVSGSAQPKLTSENLMSIKTIVPPIDEQLEIMEILDKQLNIINTKIQKTKDIITLQKEYRTALISEVVTGKIKVTEEV